MSELSLDKAYWTKRYKDEQTQWDIGFVSPSLKAYFDKLDNKNIKILIPGAGNSYEAEYLHKKGFTDVYVIDIAKAPLDNLKKRTPDFPEEYLIEKNFFDLEGKYDLIVEQTFFCALNPSLRQAYIKKMKSLLEDKGKLAGLLFTNVLLDRNEPPFGAKEEEYLAFFEGNFQIQDFAPAQNSIPERQGHEYFFVLSK